MEQYGAPPKNWLVEAILVTLFCCLPFGIVAIINAANVNTKWAAGDFEGAEHSAAEAKKWVKYSVIVGAIVIVAYIIFMITAGVGAVWMGSQQ